MRERKPSTEPSGALGTAPVGKLLLQMAVPTIAAQLINMLYNIVDRVYIGHIPGEGTLALTGMGVCLPVIMLVTAFASFASSGGAARASIAMGRGDNAAAERILGNCALMQVCLSALLTAVLLIWNRDLLLAFGASENTIGYAAGYMQIYALGTLFVQLTMGLNAFITAQGFARTGMLTVAIGAVCNIVLDPIFIFGLSMGVRGAALATVISQMISCAFVLWFLCSRRATLSIRRQNLRLEPAVLLPCVALGCAPFIMIASESVISVCFNASLLRYGGDMAVGAMTILASVMQFTMLPLQGLGQGAQPIASYNYGAGNAGRVRRTFWLLLRASVLYSAAIWALMQLWPQLPIALFTPDAALAAYTETAVRVYFAVSVIFGVQIACQMILIVIGSARASVAVAVMRKFVLLIPLIYILPHLFPADRTMAVYAAEPVADALAVTFTCILFAAHFKKAMRRMEAGGGKVGTVEAADAGAD